MISQHMHAHDNSTQHMHACMIGAIPSILWYAVYVANAEVNLGVLVWWGIIACDEACEIFATTPTFKLQSVSLSNCTE